MRFLAFPLKAWADARSAHAPFATDVVATPHANSRYRYDRTLIDAQIAELALKRGHSTRL